MKKLSAKQLEILTFVGEYKNNNGYAPTVREICSAVGLKSPSTVHSHLQTLMDNGYLIKEQRKTRTLHVQGETPQNCVPILGKVTAGAPILAFEDNVGFVPFYKKSLDNEYFGLIIKGDSMINAGILDGDVVIIKNQSTASHGDIVIALLDDEATCKRLYRQNGKVMLTPENENYSPIDGTNASIIGVVCALHRKY